jgi:hypothetical protein
MRCITITQNIYNKTTATAAEALTFSERGSDYIRKEGIINVKQISYRVAL